MKCVGTDIDAPFSPSRIRCALGPIGPALAEAASASYPGMKTPVNLQATIDHCIS
jgi:hypothetical protein